MAFVLGENHFRKYFSGNAGVWLVRKIEFSGNWFPLTEKKRLWLRKWISVPIFTSNEFRRERERSTHAHTSPRRSHAPSSSPCHSHAPAPSITIWDHNLTFASVAIGAVLREIPIDDAVIRLELAKHRAVEPCRASSVNLGFVRVFWVCLFLVVFSKHQKIFFGKFFEIQSNTWKHFPFRKYFYTNQTQPKNSIIQFKYNSN